MVRAKAANRSSSNTGNSVASGHNAPDLLRSYEHFGRIDILEGGLAGSPFVDVNALANLAQQQLDTGYSTNAATLLRAAEHISFAALAPKGPADLSSRIPDELKAVVDAELHRLTESAEEGWSKSTTNRRVIKNIYTSALEQARLAFGRGAYRPALQLARAAEALSHVSDGLPATLPGDRELTRRLAS
jgi:hypothetical protein